MISEHINTVALENDWPVLRSADIEQINQLIDLLKPLKDLLETLEADGLTISLVYPGIDMLKKFYEVRRVFLLN